MKQYNTMSRRIVDRVIRNKCNGINKTEYSVRLDINLDVLALYIQRRSPRSRVYRELGLLHSTKITVLDD